MDLVLCPRCTRELPETEFGIVRARPSGRNLYCRDCIREKVRLFRLGVKAIPGRKPPVLSPFKLAIDKVAGAIEQGACTRDKIHELTKLHEDLIADSLAQLFDEGKAYYRRENDDAVYYLRKTA